MKGFALITVVLVVFTPYLIEAATSIPAVAPTIISRSQWGARSAKDTPEILLQNPPPFIIIHHSDTDGCTSQAICQARIRSIQNYHMDHNGWNDIGYNFLIGEDGNIYEGRGWSIRGAHAPNYNVKSLGICILGNYKSRVPQPAAINAVKKLLEYAVSSGKLKSDYTLLGHRQTKATSCPGQKLYELIQTWPHWKRI